MAAIELPANEGNAPKKEAPVGVPIQPVVASARIGRRPNRRRGPASSVRLPEPSRDPARPAGGAAEALPSESDLVPAIRNRLNLNRA